MFAPGIKSGTFVCLFSLGNTADCLLYVYTFAVYVRNTPF